MIRQLIHNAARTRTRRGIAAVLFAVLLPIIMGMMALALDVALIALARSQLSTAADASALAGTMMLVDEYRTRGATDLTAEIASANTQAAALALDNPTLNVGSVLIQNPDNTDGVGDVRVGYLDPTNSASTLQTGSLYTTLFNSVETSLRRNSTHVGLVPTFFGQLMGFHGTAVTVKSTATAVNYSISGFNVGSGTLNAHLLPIVLYVDNYTAMMAGTTHDDYAYDPTTGTVSAGSDNIHESLIYPVTNGSPGNWGTINVGVSNNSTSTLGSQIRYGITPTQLATFPNGTIQLDTSLSPPSITFSGNPGISAGIKDDLTSIIGDPVIIPIYDQNGDNGNNAWYRVIKFQGCRVLSVNFEGNPKYVIIQPCLVNEPLAIPGQVMSGWSEGGLIRVHISR